MREFYLVTVQENERGRLERALRDPALAEVFPNVGRGRYAEGSTSWEVVVESPATRQRQADVLHQRGITYCFIRPLTDDERDAL